MHLKLGRQLVQFVKTDIYFENRTFNWIKLEKINDTYKATLIRSIDEGEKLFIDVLKFKTVNEVDELVQDNKLGSQLNDEHIL